MEKISSAISSSDQPIYLQSQYSPQRDCSIQGYIPIYDKQGVQMYYVSEQTAQKGPAFNASQWSANDFQILQKLGQGSFGKVFNVRLKEEKYKHLKMAMKVQNIHGETDINFFIWLKNEVEIHSHLHHPNIIALLGVFWTQTQFACIMENAEGGCLYQKLLKTRYGFQEEQAANYINQFVDALQYMHSKNIMHRDIKPQNILINRQNQLKICDFGFATLIKNYRDTRLGSLIYQCPELIRSTKYNKTAEYWALGVLTYELCAKVSPFDLLNPFDGDAEQTIGKRIKQEKYDMPIKFSKELKDFVRRLLVVTPEDRMNLEEAKRHPWLRKFDKK